MVTSTNLDTTARPPLNSLTGMRFVAAFLVFFTHVLSRLIPNSYVYADGLDAFWQTTGRVGVSFFFILSGFVLTWSARASDSVWSFWRRRVCKLFPNHLVTAFAAVVLFLVTGQAVSGEALIPNLLLIHAWFPALEISFGINPVSWSLACEAFFYLCFPLFLFWISGIRPERLWAWAGVVFAAIWAVPVVADLLLPSSPPLIPGLEYSALQDWFLYTFPATRSLEFILGIILARILITGRWINVGLLPAVLLFPVFFVASLFLPGVYAISSSMMILPLVLIIASGATADLQQKRTFMRNRVMVWLGDVSFALYMVHFLVIVYGADLLGFSQTEDAPLGLALFMIIPFLAVSLVLSWLLYRFVELPVMRNWARPASARRKPATEPEQTPSRR